MATLTRDNIDPLAIAFDSVAKRIENNLRQVIGCEIRKYRTKERLSGRELSWEQAWQEWTKEHGERLEQFLIESLFSSESDLQKI